MSRDLYAEITARIVAALEQGVAPWVRPWSVGADTLPLNASSRRPYRGVNVILLELEAQAHGYPLNRWLTYRQADELGGQARRGEQGTTVVFWKLRQVAATADTYPTGPSPIFRIGSSRCFGPTPCSTSRRSRGCQQTCLLRRHRPGSRRRGARSC